MKEKRIFCIEVSGKCRYFANINSPLNADIFECKHAKYTGITRKQAIEKMAKAMCRKSNGGTCDGCSVFEEPDKERCKEIYMHPEFVDGAEAALNALLEAKNEN